MATALENLITARDNVAARLAEVTASLKPTYTVDGESYSWESYQAMLTDQLAKLNALIQQQSGPWEVRSRSIT